MTPSLETQRLVLYLHIVNVEAQLDPLIFLQARNHLQIVIIFQISRKTLPQAQELHDI
jgi:hypothetical protein